MDISDISPLGVPILEALPIVMLVEDNPHDVQLLQEAFRERQISVKFITARSALQAYGVLRLLPSGGLPCLIIIDLSLPLVPGHALLRGFSTEPHWRKIPKVVLTSSDRPTDRVESLAAGAVEHIVKPAVFEKYLELVDHLQTYLSTRSDVHDPPTSLHGAGRH